MRAAHNTPHESTTDHTTQSPAKATHTRVTCSSIPDAALAGQPTRKALCQRLWLLSTLADHSRGVERVVLEARVHLVFRTIARGDS